MQIPKIALASVCARIALVLTLLLLIFAAEPTNLAAQSLKPMVFAVSATEVSACPSLLPSISDCSKKRASMQRSSLSARILS